MADLKSENERKLTGLLLIALVPLYVSIISLHSENLHALAQNASFTSIVMLTSLGIGPVVCIKAILHLLLNNVNALTKERLVYGRWHNPLPGCRAHRLIPKDSRVYVEGLTSTSKKLLREDLSAEERNFIWYKEVYSVVRDSHSVRNTHKRYLLYRDAAAGAFTTLMVIFIADVFSRLSSGTSLMMLYGYFFLVLYILLLMGSARQAGERLVTGAVINFESISEDKK